MKLTPKEISQLPIEEVAELVKKKVWVGKRYHEAMKFLSEGLCVSCREEEIHNEYSSLCKDCDRVVTRAKKYGTSPKTVNLLEKLNKCMCCGKVGDGDKRVAFDHNHETGELRGTLCFNCNSAIGKLGDDVKGLINAIEYISRGLQRNYDYWNEQR